MTGQAHRIVRLAETVSTNKDAMRLALNGEPLPLWVSADRQTGGRGRQGREWTSLAGNLHASVAFSTSAAPGAAGQIALLAGVAFYEAVAASTALVGSGLLRLKWPNDLLIGQAKAGGILVESTLPAQRDATGMLVVAGFGLNIVKTPELDRPVTSLAHHGAAVDTEIVLATLADSFETWLDKWDGGRGFASIRSEWLKRGGDAGEPISINTGRGAISGTYQGLSDNGALLASIGDRLEEFNFGDVALENSSPRAR